MVNFLLNPMAHRLRLPQGPSVNLPGQLCFAHLHGHCFDSPSGLQELNVRLSSPPMSSITSS
jgi:hypothetical protein